MIASGKSLLSLDWSSIFAFKLLEASSLRRSSCVRDHHIGRKTHIIIIHNICDYNTIHPQSPSERAILPWDPSLSATRHHHMLIAPMRQRVDEHLAIQALSTRRGGPGNHPQVRNDPAPPNAPGQASSLALERAQRLHPKATAQVKNRGQTVHVRSAMHAILHSMWPQRFLGPNQYGDVLEETSEGQLIKVAYPTN